jgi:hypothetical protein
MRLIGLVVVLTVSLLAAPVVAQAQQAGEGNPDWLSGL